MEKYMNTNLNYLLYKINIGNLRVNLQCGIILDILYKYVFSFFKKRGGGNIKAKLTWKVHYWTLEPKYYSLLHRTLLNEIGYPNITDYCTLPIHTNNVINSV